ncbi:MAG: ABC transporter substrate-binding protein [Acidimicrobiales bacterium]|jgi:polar amino acid transport system substrate-binding protein
MNIVHHSPHSLRRFKAVSVSALLAGTALIAGTTTTAFAAASRPAHSAVTIPTPPKDPKVAALVPASIKKQGFVSAAMDATYPPDEFVAANGTTIIGMDADFNVALGAIMGVKWRGVNATFDTIIAGIQGGRYDVGNSSFTVEASREQKVNFVTYFQAGEAYYVKSSSTVKLNGLLSLCGRTVSVESGTSEQTDAVNTEATCKKDHKVPDTVLPFSTQSEANLAVTSGRALIGFADSQVAGYIVQLSKGTFKLDGSAFEVAPYGFAFSKKSTLDKATLAAVKDLMKDGIYAKILAKWGVQAGAINNPQILT